MATYDVICTKCRRAMRVPAYPGDSYECPRCRPSGSSPYRLGSAAASLRRPSLEELDEDGSRFGDDLSRGGER